MHPVTVSPHQEPVTYRKLERGKRRKYEERIHEAEHGSFSLLVFSATAEVFYKRLASLMSEKNDLNYATTMV